MAKVTAPLFSFEAHGQLAKTLVFMDWKGINDVRKYTVPANPNSAGQQSQRGFFKDGVVDFHAVPLDADDLAAWNLAHDPLDLVEDLTEAQICGDDTLPSLGGDASFGDLPPGTYGFRAVVPKAS